MAVKLKPLAKQSIVVTGASSGIGLATARRAAEAGARVLLVARGEEALKEAVHGITVRGGRAEYLAIDVTEADAPERIADKAMAAFGGFDSWINNAAAAAYAELADMTLDEHRRLFDVGYFATVAGALHAARALRNKGGAIINVGSVLSERAIPIQGAYSAMKHAVRGFTDALRMELEMDGAPISVTLVKPNGIDTPYPEHARNKMDAPATIPPIVYDPELVAKAICFACETPRRDLTVGGQGYLVTKLGNAMPRAMDRIMEATFGPLQQGDKAPRPGMADNLYEPREGGHVHGQADGYVRRTSLSLEAQLHPWATAAVVGGAAAALTALVVGARARLPRNGDGYEPGYGDEFVAGIIDPGAAPPVGSVPVMDEDAIEPAVSAAIIAEPRWRNL